jgi:hypothetical protein
VRVFPQLAPHPFWQFSVLVASYAYLLLEVVFEASHPIVADRPALMTDVTDEGGVTVGAQPLGVIEAGAAVFVVG